MYTTREKQKRIKKDKKLRQVVQPTLHIIGIGILAPMDG
jgi:hypothetical protein